MAICQMMIKDFMYGIGDTDDYSGIKTYDTSDLDIGIAYAQDLLKEGFIKEPFHFYDLKKFLKWAKNKRHEK